MNTKMRRKSSRMAKKTAVQDLGVPSEDDRTSSKAQRPRKRKYLAQRAYPLRAHLAGGQFAPGDHLKEEVLVNVLGVSRSVVRQALLQLTAECLIVDQPKRGKTVAQYTEERLAKLLPIRISLEQLAVREAIGRLTEADAAELKQCAARLMDPNLTLADQDAYDINLHRTIWRIADNDELERMLSRIVGPFHLMANAALLLPVYHRNRLALSWQQVLFEREFDAGGHQLLVEAICKRNTAVAVKAMEDHLAINYASSPEDSARGVATLMHAGIRSVVNA